MHACEVPGVTVAAVDVVATAGVTVGVVVIVGGIAIVLADTRCRTITGITKLRDLGRGLNSPAVLLPITITVTTTFTAAAVVATATGGIVVLILAVVASIVVVNVVACC